MSGGRTRARGGSRSSSLDARSGEEQPGTDHNETQRRLAPLQQPAPRVRKDGAAELRSLDTVTVKLILAPDGDAQLQGTLRTTARKRETRSGARTVITPLRVGRAVYPNINAARLVGKRRFQLGSCPSTSTIDRRRRSRQSFK